MKLALARRGFSPTGGAEAYLRRFAAALAAAGHEPTLYTDTPWPEGAWPHRQVSLPKANSPESFAQRMNEAKFSPGELLFSLERLRECACYRAGDGVHAAWLARRGACQPAWRRLARQWQPKHRQLLRLERSMFAARGAGAVIVNSRMVAREITEHYGYEPDRIHLIYNGVPPAPTVEQLRAFRTEVRAELGMGAGEYVALFAGSGWERKGLRQAIAAVESSSTRPVLLIAGAGRRWNLPPSSRSRFLGPVRGLSRYFAAADLFLLPTLYDPFSNACLEALASGLPVVTTTANGVAEILGPEHGEAIEDPFDIGALAAAIDRWKPGCANPDAIRAHAEGFSVEANLKRTLAVLQTLAAG